MGYQPVKDIAEEMNITSSTVQQYFTYMKDTCGFWSDMIGGRKFEDKAGVENPESVFGHKHIHVRGEPGGKKNFVMHVSERKDKTPLIPAHTDMMEPMSTGSSKSEGSVCQPGCPLQHLVGLLEKHVFVLEKKCRQYEDAQFDCTQMAPRAPPFAASPVTTPQPAEHTNIKVEALSDTEEAVDYYINTEVESIATLDIPMEPQTQEYSTSKEIQTQEDSTNEELQTQEDSTNEELQTQEDSTNEELHTQEDSTKEELQSQEDGSKEELQSQEDGIKEELQTQDDGTDGEGDDTSEGRSRTHLSNGGTNMRSPDRVRPSLAGTSDRFVCSYKGCVARFRSRRDKALHMKFVHKVKPLFCPIEGCRYQTGLCRLWRKHIACQHAQAVHCPHTDCDDRLNTTKRRVHPCPQAGCSFRSFQLQDTQRHYRARHIGVKSFKCSVCEFRASLREYVVKHFIRCHGAAELVPCGRCAFRALGPEDLDNHMLSKHQRSQVKFRICLELWEKRLLDKKVMP